MAADVVGKYRKHVITSCVKKLEPITLVEGKDAVLKNSTGKQYIDAFAGISVVNNEFSLWLRRTEMSSRRQRGGRCRRLRALKAQVA